MWAFVSGINLNRKSSHNCHLTPKQLAEIGKKHENDPKNKINWKFFLHSQYIKLIKYSLNHLCFYKEIPYKNVYCLSSHAIGVGTRTHYVFYTSQYPLIVYTSENVRRQEHIAKANRHEIYASSFRNFI